MQLLNQTASSVACLASLHAKKVATLTVGEALAKEKCELEFHYFLFICYDTHIKSYGYGKLKRKFPFLNLN